MTWLFIQALYACVHQATSTPMVNAEARTPPAADVQAVEVARGIGNAVEVSCVSDQMAVVVADRKSVAKVAELPHVSVTSDVSAPVVVLPDVGEVIGLSFHRKLSTQDGNLYGEAYSASPDGAWILVIRHSGPLFALRLPDQDGGTGTRVDLPVPGMMVRSIAWSTPSTAIIAAENRVFRIGLGGETPSVEEWPATSDLATGDGNSWVWAVQGGHGHWNVASIGGSDSSQAAGWTLVSPSAPLALKVLSGEPFILTRDGSLWRKGAAVAEVQGAKMAGEGESITSFCLAEKDGERRAYLLAEAPDSWRVLMVPLLQVPPK